MRAVIVTEYGDPDVLVEVDLPAPEPGPGEVAIDVAYASVGLVDVFFRRGDLADAVGVPDLRPPFIPGLEVAGTIRSLGPGVTDFAVGESVATLSRISLGGYASIAVADAALTITLTGTGIDLAQAVAALPNTTTALLALTEATTVRPGDVVLVHGATGGLAAAFPAVARSLGAGEVIGTIGSNRRMGAARALGYDAVLTYSDVVAGMNGRPVDLVVDPVGGWLRTASLDLLAPMGRLLAVGHAGSDADEPISTDRLWLANRTVVGFNVGDYLAGNSSPARMAAARAVDLLAAGCVHVPVEVLPLERAGEAHRRLQDRTVDGRLVLNLAA